MEFKVRWAGFGESYDSWESYKALLHADKLRDYLRANLMRTLIPSEDFPRNFLPHKGLFPDWFLVGENPHISVQPTSCITLSTLRIVSHTSHAYKIVESGTISTPGLPVTHPPGLLRAVSHIQISHSFLILCDSLRSHIYSPVP